MADDRKVTVECPLGKVRGLIQKDFNGRDYYNFRGVPYAQPPVGSLRFQPPEPLKSWAPQEWDATYPRENCYQLEFGHPAPSGSEDCLYLNIYTPHVAPKKLLPVMVWFHGGGYQWGTPCQDEYGPDFLMTQDVILVSVGYRLNVFGFFQLPGDPHITGNQGLKDQVEALRWIKRSIQSFGGDSGNVTIFGQSAGGGCTHLHTLSPLSRSLFHKAIAQSGTALTPWGFSRKQSAAVARKLQTMAKTSKEQLKLLMQLSSAELFKWHQEVNQDFFDNDQMYSCEILGAFGPMAEPAHAGAFITAHPRDLIKQGKIHDVPFMSGYVSDEGFIFSIDLPDIPKAKNESLIPRDLAVKYNEDAQTIKDLEEKVRKFYFNDSEPNSPEGKLRQPTYRSDSMFNYDILETVRLTAPVRPTYFYYFTVKARANFIINKVRPMLPPEALGTFSQVTAHADEMSYLLLPNFVSRDFFEEGSVEWKTMQRMVTLWTNFAKEGNPTGADPKKVLDGVEWPKVGRDVEYLRIDNDGVRVVRGVPDEDRVMFWDGLYGLK